MRVLITQPAQEAAVSAQALTARGHEPVLIPLVTVEREAKPAINLASAQAFMTVSPEGVRALADLVGVRTFPIFVDSDLTAAEAKRAGFKEILAAKDDTQDLARLVERSLKPANGALIYACSTAAPVNLPAMLGNMGFAVRPLPLYSIKRVDHLPDALREKLVGKAIDVALFMSPDEARAFVTLLQRDETPPPIAGLKTVTATPAIAAPLRALKGASITVASASDPDSVWATLDGELIDRVEEERLARERHAREEEDRRRADEERRRKEEEARAQRAREKEQAERAEKERIAAERAAAAKAAAAQAEMERLARLEEQRIRAEEERRRREEAERERQEKLAREAAERAEREKERIERERLKAEEAARQKAERERVAAERAEQERRRKEEEDRARVERARLKAEEETRLRAEKERIAAERAEQERLRKEQEAQAQAERTRLKAEEEAKLRAEKERVAAERVEQERLRKEQEAQAHAERARLKAEEEAKLRAEKERIAAERAEQERLRKEQEERERAARIEQERLQHEQEARERAEAARIAAEKALAEKAEQERRAKEAIARDEAERQRLAAERAAWEEAERIRLAAEHAERARENAARIAREAAEREHREKERAERERLARAEAERLRIEKERIALEEEKARQVNNRIAREQAEAARIAREAKAEAERAEKAQRAEATRIEKEKREDAARIEKEARAAAAQREKEAKAEAEREAKERRAAEKAEAVRATAARAAEEAEQKRLAREEAAAQKARDEIARREEAASARAEQERLAAEHAERLRQEREDAARAKAERKRLAEEQKAEAKAQKARLKAEQAPIAGWTRRLWPFGARTATPADTPDPRWAMTTGLDAPHRETPPLETASTDFTPADLAPLDTSLAVASAAPSWNDAPMSDPSRNAKDTPEPSEGDNASPAGVPLALVELNELVERETAATRAKDSVSKDSGTKDAITQESLADAKPAARSGGGRSAQMLAEDAADDRARDRLKNWGRSEAPEQQREPEPESFEPIPDAVAAPREAGRGPGRSIALFFGLATIVTAGLMTTDKWLPLVIGETETPVVTLPTPTPATTPAPAAPPVKPTVPAPASAAAVPEAALPPADIASANQTIANLMARVATLEAALGNAALLDEVNKRVDMLEGRSADANSVLALADRVTALEQAGRSAADKRAVAVALTIAATQWRDSVVAGRPFVKEWDTVKALTGEATTNAVFASYANTGLPTLPALRRDFDTTAAAVIRAGLLPNGASGWLRRTLDRVLSVVTIRRIDADVGDDAEAILVRAGRAVDAGNLADATTELKKLTGAQLTAAMAWITAAEARAAAEDAAHDTVLTAAAGLSAPTPPQAYPATPAAQ